MKENVDDKEVNSLFNENYILLSIIHCYIFCLLQVLVAPVLAGLAVGIGVPILLFYVYGVVPVSLCRSGGCGVSTNGSGVRFEFDDENELMGALGGRNVGGKLENFLNIFIQLK